MHSQTFNQCCLTLGRGSVSNSDCFRPRYVRILFQLVGELSNFPRERSQLRDSLGGAIDRVELSLRRDLSPIERDHMEAARENLTLARKALEGGQLSEANRLIKMAERELWGTI